MKNHRLFPLVLVLVGITILGCQMPLDDSVDVTDGGAPDFTSFSGITIMGERSVNGNATKIGPLDLAEVQVTLFTLCYDQLVESEPVIAGYCAEPGSVTPGTCKDSVCKALVFNCLGYKNLELAEATGVYEFESSRLLYNAFITNGEILFELLGGRDGSVGAAAMYSFRIPPLTTVQKTLAYRAARAAFREAGIQSSTLIMDDADPTGNWACYKDLITQSPNSEDQLTVLNYFTHALAESTSKFIEAMQLTATNELNVASATVSKVSNPADAQQKIWREPINSNGAVMDGLFGNTTGQPQHTGCVTEFQSSSQRTAVAVLRSARLRDTLLTDSVTDSALVDQMARVLSSDAGDKSTPSGVDFLWRRGFTLATRPLLKAVPFHGTIKKAVYEGRYYKAVGFTILGPVLEVAGVRFAGGLLGRLGRWLRGSSRVARGGPSAFEVAQAGGKHSGFLKNYVGRSRAEIQRGITSIEKQVAQHQAKIANPEKYIEGWSKIDPRQQQALINRKWPTDIQRQTEQIEVLKGLLGGGQ